MTYPYIGIRLHDAAGTGLDEKLASAKAQGFQCVHLAMQKVVPGFKMADAAELLTDEMAARVRESLDRAGMECVVLGCYLNLATPDAEQLERTLAIYRAHLRFARLIGARMVGTETGAPNTAYKTEPACWTDEALDLFIAQARKVAGWAADEGAVFAIEPVCRHIVHTPERCERVLDAVQSDALRVILDSVNLITPENAARADEAVIEESIRRFGDRVAMLHMKDYRVVPGKSDVASMACGLGDMHYERLMRFSRERGGLPMTLEDTVPDNAVAAKECLLAVDRALG